MPLTTSPLPTLARVGLLMSILATTACSGGGGGAETTAAAPAPIGVTPPPPPPPPPPPTTSALDTELRGLITANNLTGDPRTGRVLPSIDAPLPQLGRLLFFSKALSANRDTACASCHHPALGGADSLSLSVGTGAALPNVMGPGRRRADGQILVGRNANSFFNTGLFDQVLFWDGRIESLGKEPNAGGSASGIRTPASAFGSADAAAGPNLLAAQARFPVTGVDEMRGSGFPGLSPAQVRDHVAARLGNFGSGAGALAPGDWLARFRTGLGQPAGTAEQLITFDNIMRAIAEFQRSATFVETPWRSYIQGNLSAITDTAKRGALLFYKGVAQGGQACVQCHKGDFFTDEKFHALGFPQVGPGMGDGVRDDFGRERQSGSAAQRGAFRTPSLLNVELSAPYGHAGSYGTLNQAVDHYAVPQDTVNAFLSGRQWCALPQFVDLGGCGADAATVDSNTRAALARMEANRRADPAGGMPLINLALGAPTDTLLVVDFLRTLTDPCLKDRACIGRWIPTPAQAPDTLQLNATDARGAPL